MDRLTPRLLAYFQFSAGLRAKLGIVFCLMALTPMHESYSQADAGTHQLSFKVSLDPRHNALKDEYVEPTELALKKEIIAQSNLDVYAYVKKAPKRKNLLQLEVFIENKSNTPLTEVNAYVESIDGQGFFSDKGFFDFTHNPFTQEKTALHTAMDLGDMTGYGMARLVLALPHGFAEVSMQIRVEAKTTTGDPINSSTLALTQDGKELWSVFADGNQLALIDTDSDSVIKNWSIEGQPYGVGVVNNGKMAVVTLAKSNEVILIERNSLEIIQTLGEQDGLGKELRHLVVSPDGKWVAVSGYVSDTVDLLAFDGSKLNFVKQLPVGRRPMGLSISRDSSTIYVGHFLPRGPVINNESFMTVIDLESQQVVKETILEDQFNLDNAACVKKPFENPILRLLVGKVSDEDIALESVASQLTGVFLNPNGSTAFVPGTRVSGGVQMWEAGPNASKDVSGLVTYRPGELSIPIIFMMDTRGKHTLAPQILDGYERPGANKEYSRCLALEREFDYTSYDIRTTAPNEYVNRLATFATGISGLSETGNIRQVTYTLGGRRALLLSYTSDEIVMQDALTGHPSSIRHFMLEGANPTGIIVSKDGNKAYVNYANEPSVTTLDLSAYANVDALPGPSYVPYKFEHVKDVPFIIGVGGGRKEEWLIRNIKELPRTPKIKQVSHIRVGKDPMDKHVRRGKVLFSSSNPEKYSISASRLGSCESCHPDGGNDGSAWATMEGERRTMSLRGGVQGRGWLHISATHQDAHEFVDIIVKERFGGQLTHEDHEALAEYISFHIPKLQPPKTDSQLAARGEQLFESNCVSCHPMQGSGNPGSENPWGGATDDPYTWNIGTGTDSSFVVLGTVFERLFPKAPAELLKNIRGDRDLGEGDYAQKVLDYRQRPNRKKGFFKTPSMINVWDNAVFFHSASVGSLREATIEIFDRLGMEKDEQDIDALVEYMKTL